MRLGRSSALFAAAVAVPLFSTSALASTKIIFDTDMQTDVDDAGALALLNALADRGYAQVLAAMVSSLHPYAGGAVDAINTYYGRGAIPIGTLQRPGVNLSSNYAQYVAQNFPQDLSNPPDAVRLYREILASQEDHSVTIVTLGYATNLRDLLASGPDQYSPLTGAELVAQKVSKWVNMGGNFETRQGINSTNVNWTRDTDAAVTAINDWPTEIVFAGREIGHTMRAGERLSETPEDNPVRVAYEKYFNSSAKDHHLADIVPVMYAVVGTEFDNGSGVEKYWALESGQIQMNADASFTWTPGATGERAESRLIDAISNPGLGLLPPSQVQERLEELMIAAPRGRDLSGPSAASSLAASPDNNIAGRVMLSWSPASETDQGSWVAGYNVYREGVLVGTAYGTRYFDSVPLAGNYQYTIRAFNVSGIEGDPVSLTALIGSGTGMGDGLKGEYFDNDDLIGLKFTRIDGQVNFDWGSGSPSPDIGVDSFSVRWTGYIQPAHATGTHVYTFSTESNDGVRLWVDGELLIDSWVPGGGQNHSGSIELEAGKFYEIRLEYFENTYSAMVRLSWESDGLAREIIPQARLYSVVPEPTSLTMLALGGLMLMRHRR